MSWITVAKPTSTSWSRSNPQGREQYDESTFTYDDSALFYDGVNQSQWTSILKPTTVYTWDTATFTWDSFSNPWESPTWTLITKP